MNRQQLEHVLRAAAAITGADRFVVIGSQAILGPHPDAPRELVESMEVDLFSLRSPEDADLIDGSIGELSPFHRSFGYWAHGVGIETAVLPEGWQGRLIPIQNNQTNGAVGLCLEENDLAVSKLVAGREKDLTFVAALLLHGFAKAPVMQERLAHTAIDAERRAIATQRLARLISTP